MKANPCADELFFEFCEGKKEAAPGQRSPWMGQILMMRARENQFYSP
jgi:hypothetical protein